MSDRLKLLIVDDSQVTREGVSIIFDADDDIDVVGEASNGQEALEQIELLQPDVISLDINMPVMDGLSALKHIMIKHPTPTLMLSSLTQEGEKTTFDALRYGAVDFIPKPSKLSNSSLQDQADVIRRKVHTAANVEVGALRYIRPIQNSDTFATQENVAAERVVCIGAAEGGYSPLITIIPHLEVNSTAAFLTVLYAESEYVDAFVNYINEFSAVHVKRAVHGEEIKAGICYISAGDDYTTVHREHEKLVLHVNPAPFAFRKGSIDRALFSAADLLGEKTTAVLLSGLGNDGAEGLAEVIRSGGVGIIQEPESCLCREIPETALEWCDPSMVIPDYKIAEVVNSTVSSNAEL